MLKTRISQDINCHECPSQSLCIPTGLSHDELENFNNFISKIRIIKKKNHVFYANTAMQNIYAIYQGSCKEYWIDEKGNECITNFYFPGDLIGLESIPDRMHLLSVMALEYTELCVLPIEPFFSYIQQEPAVLRRFFNITSFKMQNDKIIHMGVTANERVCDFLLNIIQRMRERNQSVKNIHLPMSQLDISNYLGIAYETVNRIFQNLKRKKIISMKNKTLAVLNLEELERLGKLDYSLKK